MIPQLLWDNFLALPRPSADEIDAIYKMFDDKIFLCRFWWDADFVFSHCSRAQIKTFCAYFAIPCEIEVATISRAPAADLQLILFLQDQWKCQSAR